MLIKQIIKCISVFNLRARARSRSPYPIFMCFVVAASVLLAVFDNGGIVPVDFPPNNGDDDAHSRMWFYVFIV